MTGAPFEIDSVSVAFPIPMLFDAVIVTVEVPPVEGVPEINPFEVFTDKPAGNPDAPKLVG